MKFQVILIVFSFLNYSELHAASIDATNNREARQVMTLAVDSLSTPILTTPVDAMGGTTTLMGGSTVPLMSTVPINLGMGLDPLGLGLGVNNLVTPGLGGSTLVDNSGLGTGVGLTATMGEAVGNWYDLMTAYIFTPVDTTNSFYILPPNLQAFVPDMLFLNQSPPTYDNYIFACDLYGTGMCYYYYYSG